MRLSGKSILVTGGATGIGFELAGQLVARGNRVVICGRRKHKVDAALVAIPGLRGVACDLSENADITSLREFVRRELGPLDILINNAGIQVQTVPSEGDGDFTALDAELMTNLGAPIKLTEAFLPTLLERPEAAVVNMCSLLGVMPKPNAPGYCASKAGLLVFSRALRQRLAGTSVRVIAVFPPLVATPMTHGRGTRKMAPDVFVREMLRQLELDRPEIRVGQARTLLALHRAWPAFAEWWTRRISAGSTRREPERDVRAGR
jgi:uncharacterized oxidoreductase